MRLIDADVLIEKLGISEKCDCCQYNSMDNCEKGLDFVETCCEIYNAPTVVTHPKWIPCSERLPEDETLVLVYYILNQPIEETRDIWIGWHEMDNMWYVDGEEHGEEWNNEVLAWMPLPEPYKGE